MMGQIAALAASGASGIPSILSGNAQKSAYDTQAMEMRQQSKLVEAQAQEQQASLQDRLNQTVGAISAITASRGLNIDSPSAQAVIGQRKKTANTDIATTGANAAMQAGQLNESALAAIQAGNNAQMNSWFQAVGSSAEFASKFFAGGG